MCRAEMVTFSIALFVLCILAFSKSISGLMFYISYNETLVEDTGILPMMCNVTGPDIEAVYAMEIQRERLFLPNTFETIVKMEGENSDETPKLPEQIINDKDYVTYGTLDKITPNNTYLALKMNIQKFSCSEFMAFRCEMTYKNSSTGLTTTVTQNLSDNELPIIHSVQGKKNGRLINGQSASFNASDKLELTCSIVSQYVGGVELYWQKSDGSIVVGERTGYQYLECSGFHCITKNLDYCCHIRTAIKYSITYKGANRFTTNLTFQCCMSNYSDPHEGYSITIGQQFHAYFSSDRITKESGGDMTMVAIMLFILVATNIVTASYLLYVRVLMFSSPEPKAHGEIFVIT